MSSSLLAHDVVGDPGAPTSIWLVHGILGRGRNWRSFARRWVDTHPESKAVTLDLRNHGSSPSLPGPHTLEACAHDLTALAEAIGQPDNLVGHSFGGKVVLTWLDGLGETGPTTHVLDSPPGPTAGRDEAAVTAPANVFKALRAAPAPAPSRSVLRDHLVGLGLPRAVVAWLLTSCARTDDGWDWVWNLPGVQAMLDDYDGRDMWPVVRRWAHKITILRGGASDHWVPEELSRVDSLAQASALRTHALKGAGHLVHVDDPDGTFAWISAQS